MARLRGDPMTRVLARIGLDAGVTPRAFPGHQVVVEDPADLAFSDGFNLAVHDWPSTVFFGWNMDALK